MENLISLILPQKIGSSAVIEFLLMFAEGQMMTEISSSAMENVLSVIVHHKHHILLFLPTHPETLNTSVLLPQVVWAP